MKQIEAKIKNKWQPASCPDEGPRWEYVGKLKARKLRKEFHQTTADFPHGWYARVLTDYGWRTLPAACVRGVEPPQDNDQQET